MISSFAREGSSDSGGGRGATGLHWEGGGPGTGRLRWLATGWVGEREGTGAERSHHT